MAKMYKKVGGGVPFARKVAYEYEGQKFEADLKDGDIVKIMDSGNVEMGQYGEQTNFKIKTRNGEKRIAFNQKSINVLIDEFGDDSEDWVNKSVRVLLKKDVIAGKKVLIPYFVTSGWSIDEYGELVKEGAENQDQGNGDDVVDLDDLPEDEIR